PISRSPHSTLFPYTTLFRSTPYRIRDEYPDQWEVHLQQFQTPHHQDPRFQGWKTFVQDAAIAASVTRPSVIANTSLADTPISPRSEEHTSELQSRGHLVCRL